jgi:CheY-like chemotaxis protein
MHSHSFEMRVSSRDQRRILVVESDPAITSLLRVLFDREGFETFAVEHGPEAMRIIESGECASYGAIVVQCAPVASPADPSRSMGIAFLNFLAEANPACLSRTIVLTTFTRHAPKTVFAVCRVLVEPFDIDELTAAVRGCTECGSQSDASKR